MSIEKSKLKAEAIEKRLKDKENLELVVGDLNDIKLKEKFDYIVITEAFERANEYITGNNCFEELLKYCKNLLKDDGKILLATNNKFGIQYWNNKKYIDYEENSYYGLYKDIEYNKPQNFSKKQLTKMIGELGLKSNFYYVFSDYKMPNLIYSERYELTNEDMGRVFTYYNENQLINFYENQVLSQIRKEGNEFLNFFANSFFIEISKQEITNNVNYITFTNYRKEKYRICTTIKDNEVIKKATNDKAEEHILEMKDFYQYLDEYNIDIIEQYTDNKFMSKYIKSFTRYDVYLENSKTIEELKEKLKIYTDILYDKSINYNEIDINDLNDDIKKIDVEKLKKFKFLKYGFLDLIPKNCFYINGKLSVFDQEWMGNYIPVEYILYRGIKNTNLVEKFTIKIYKELNLSEFIDIFENLEKNFNEKVVDKTLLYNVFNRKVITQAETIATLKHYNNLNNIKENEIITLTSENQQKENKIRELESQLENKEKEIQAITNSTSWKITKPLRKLKGLAK